MVLHVVPDLVNDFLVLEIQETNTIDDIMYIAETDRTASNDDLPDNYALVLGRLRRVRLGRRGAAAIFG